MVWELAVQEYRQLKSRTNRRRVGRLVYAFRKYTDGDPTIASYIEFISKLSKDDMTTPFLVARAARYFSENRALSRGLGLPFFAGAYIMFDAYVERGAVWAALKSVENQSVQAFFALMISGIKYYGFAIRVRLEEYDRDTGIVCDQVKVTPLAKLYLDAQYDRAIAQGLGPSDPLFFVESRTGQIRRINLKDIKRYNKRATVETGVDIFKYCLLSYRMRRFEPGKVIKIKRGAL